MTLLNKIPGTVLVLLGALCLSFGGIIVKSFEGANLWQILFWRQTFFSIIVALYLLIQKIPGEKIFFELIKLHEAEQLYKELLNSISEIIKNIKEIN